MLSLALFGVALALVFQISDGSDLVKHVTNTQSICTEVYSRRTRDCRWHADLDVYADQEILNGCHVIAFKLRWFSGSWSRWFVVGVNDIDGKVNLGYRRCNGGYTKHNTMRRWWSYFYDHDIDHTLNVVQENHLHFQLGGQDIV